MDYFTIIKDYLIEEMKNTDAFSGFIPALMTLVITVVLTMLTKVRKKREVKINFKRNSEVILENTEKSTMVGRENQDSTFDEISILVDRFLKVYTIHGISINQIYSFVDKEFDLKISDFKDKNSIINVLNAELLEWTAKTFGVQIEWMYGKTEKIFPSRYFYKRVVSFCKQVIALRDKVEFIQIIFIRESNLNYKSADEQPVGIIVEFCKEVNGSNLSLYYPITEYGDWSYWKSRYQLKSIVYLLEKVDEFNLSPVGIKLKKGSIDRIVSGKEFIQEIFNVNKTLYTWHPYDYTSNPRHYHSLEGDEYKELIDYIQNERYVYRLKEGLVVKSGESQ
ncbi:hypothetical protein [Cytobacillus sp. BC1816]|uniref:hypothetical protein n=1 Tax=Cytobacillus sp. BC1816 TaxID=3440154 RepID=UPI003F519744